MVAFGGLGIGLATAQGCGSSSGPEVVNGQLKCGDCDQYAYNCDGTAVCAPDDYTAGVGFSCYTWSEKKDCTHNAPSGTEGADDGGSDDGGQGSNCGSWDPDALVAYSRTTRKYEVDQQLIDDLEADRTLLDCDSARARLVSGGYYELHSVGRDDLSSHLGLRSGDIIKSVNGYDLLNEADYLAAYAALDGTTTEFELEVDRGGRIITIKYVIV